MQACTCAASANASLQSALLQRRRVYSVNQVRSHFCRTVPSLACIGELLKFESDCNYATLSYSYSDSSPNSQHEEPAKKKIHSSNLGPETQISSQMKNPHHQWERLTIDRWQDPGSSRRLIIAYRFLLQKTPPKTLLTILQRRSKIIHIRIKPMMIWQSLCTWHKICKVGRILLRDFMNEMRSHHHSGFICYHTMIQSFSHYWRRYVDRKLAYPNGRWSIHCPHYSNQFLVITLPLWGQIVTGVVPKHCRVALWLIDQAISDRINGPLQSGWECIHRHLLKSFQMKSTRRQLIKSVAIHVTLHLLGR